MYSNRSWYFENNFLFEKCICMHSCETCLKRPDYLIQDCNNSICDLYIMDIASLNFNVDFKICAGIRLDEDFIWWQSLNYCIYFI